MKLTDIIMPALAVFETCLSKALRNGKIDEEELNSIQMFHLKTITLYKLYAVPVRVCSTREDMHYL